MRVSNKTIYETARLRLEQLTSALSDANEVVSTGKRINKISDDPTGLTTVLNVKTTLENMAQLDKNMDNGMVWLTGSETALSSVNDIILDTKLLITQLINDSNTDTQRADAVEQIDNMIEELMSIANVQINNAYLFGGTDIDTQPLVYDNDTNPTSVVYQGSDTAFSIKSEKTATLTVGRVAGDDFWEDYVIVDFSNERIEFKEEIGGEYDAVRYVSGIIPEGKYTPDQLAVAVENAMNEASGENGFGVVYDVAYDDTEKQFSINVDGSSYPGELSVQLLFETGRIPTVGNVNTGIQAAIDISSVLADAGTGVHAGDTVGFVLSTDGQSETVSFTVDSDDDTTRANFLTALDETLTRMDNADLSVDDSQLDAESNRVTILNIAGKTIWADDVTLADNAAGTFGGDYISNGFDYAAGTGDTIGFDIMLAGAGVANVTVDVDAIGDLVAPGAVTNTMIADEISRSLNSGITMQTGDQVVFQDSSGNSVIITRNGDDFDFAATNGASFSIDNFTDDDASGAGTPVALSMTANNGTTLSSTGAAGTTLVSAGNIEVLEPVIETLDPQLFDTGGGTQRLDVEVTILNEDAVTNSTATPFGSSPLRLGSLGEGTWTVDNDPGYDLPEIISSSSDGADLDLDGDGEADIRISLATPAVGGNYFIEFDIMAALGDNSIAPDLGFYSNDLYLSTATSDDRVTPINSIVIDNTNNKIEFQETDMDGNVSAVLMATIPDGPGRDGEWTDPDALAAAIKTAMETVSVNNVTYDVSYNAEDSRFVIQDSGTTLRQLDIFWNSGPNASVNAADALGFYDHDDQMIIPVSDNAVTLFSISTENNMIDFEETALGVTTTLSAAITPGNYTRTEDIAADIEAQLEAASAAGPNSVDYTVTYDAASQRFTISDNTGTLTDLRLLWNTGGNSATSAAEVLGYDYTENTAGAFGGDILSNGWDDGDTITLDFTIGGTTLNYSHVVDTATDTSASIMEDIYNNLGTTFAGQGNFTLDGNVVDFELDHATLEISNFTDSGAGDAGFYVAGSSGSPVLPVPTDDTIYAGDTITFYSPDDDVTPGVTSWSGDNDVVLFTIDNENTYIDFEEIDHDGVSSGELTAMIPQGTYTRISDLTSAIESAIESASTLDTPDDYTVAYDTDNQRFIIKYGGDELSSFKLLWDSGSHANASAADTLGFDQSDDVMEIPASDEYVVSIRIDDTNENIDFREVVPGKNGSDVCELCATIPNGTYTDFASLAQAVEDAMNGESANFGNNITYNVKYDQSTGKFSIKEDGSTLEALQLLWESGDNSATNAATVLGYDNQSDDTDSAAISTQPAEWGIFNTLFDLKRYLSENDVDGLERSLTRLENHYEYTKSLVADIGIKTNRIQVKQSINSEISLSLEERRSNLEDADIVEAVIRLKTLELAYEAALSSTSKIMQLSLVDYL